MTRFTALVIGNETLTHECGAQLLARGHAIAAVMTRHPEVRRWAEGAVQQRRQEMARSLHERLFAWMLLADERNVAATYVGGQLRYRP